MNDGDADQHPPSSHRVAGFQVRTPRPDEIARLLAFFPSNPLGSEKILCLGAFGQPGDVPLGGAIVRPSRRGNVNIGHFLLFVRPECRRRKIGSALMQHLYSLALSNHADQLILPELIHQDRADNAFYRSCGLSPERAFATYCVSIERGLAICDPIARRFERSHPHLAGVRFESLAAIDPAQAAEFFTTHYPGFADQRLEQLRSGAYDMSLSCAALRENRIIAGSLFRSRPDKPSIMLDLVLTAPPYRHGPIALSLLLRTAKMGLEKGYTKCVFEADERFDHFAVGFGSRCGASPQWRRFRYSINRPEMESRIKSLQKGR